jgi:hypothetical protein
MSFGLREKSGDGIPQKQVAKQKRSLLTRAGKIPLGVENWFISPRRLLVSETPFSTKTG